VVPWPTPRVLGQMSPGNKSSAKLMGIRSVALLIAVMTDGNAQPKPFPKGPLPATCSVCTTADRTRQQYVGSGFQTFAKNLLKHPLPSAKQNCSLCRQEPWVFMVAVDSEGHLCTATLLHGGPDPVSADLERSLSQWTFVPFQFRGSAICFRTTIMFYLREKNGRPTYIIPGLIDGGG